MSDGKTSVYEAAKGIRAVASVLLEVAEIAAAPPAVFTRYDWRPLDPSQLLTENQASTGVLEPRSLPDPRVVLLHRHLQALLPAELTACVHAFDVRSAPLELSLRNDDGGVTRVTGRSDAALGLLSTALVTPLDRAVCLIDWKRPGYTTADWDGQFARQALLQMLAFERRYRRPVVVVLTDLDSTLRVFSSEYEGGDEGHEFQFTFSDILEYRGPGRAELNLFAHWGWLCDLLRRKAVELRSFLERRPKARVVLPPVEEDDDEGGGDDDVGSGGSRSGHDGGAGEAGRSGLRNETTKGGAAGADSRGARAWGGPSATNLHRAFCDENSPPPMDSPTSANIKRDLRNLRLQQWVSLTALR